MKARRTPSKRRFWTEAEDAAMRRLYPDTPTADVAAALDKSLSGIYQRARTLGLEKSEAYLASPAACRLRRGDNIGAAHRFKPGLVPANKGVRRPGWAPGAMAATQFKPGDRPHTWVPVGTYRINGDGYLDLKTTDEGPARRHWTSVHRLVWTAACGPIPEGHVVVFRPGRRSTDVGKITVDALELITRSELMRRNTVHNLPKELADLVQLRGAVLRQINRRSKQE